MTEYPATPFVYEARVVDKRINGPSIELLLVLPGELIKVVQLPLKPDEFDAMLAGREAFRDIAYHVFGEDWRLYEASMNSRDRRRNWAVIGRKILEEVNRIK